MSMFLIHQGRHATVALADSFASRQGPRDGSPTALNAPKLIKVAPDLFAVHAGTWQPALAMLNDLHHRISRSRKSISCASLLAQLEQIGSTRHAEYLKRFQRQDVDVRIALILTGKLRARADIKENISSTILLWEVARKFKPEIVHGHLCFAGSTSLTSYAYHCLKHETNQALLSSSPLAATQALRALHANIALISTVVSPESNVAILSESGEHSVITGQMLTLPAPALLWG